MNYINVRYSSKVNLFSFVFYLDEHNMFATYDGSLQTVPQVVKLVVIATINV